MTSKNAPRSCNSHHWWNASFPLSRKHKVVVFSSFNFEILMVVKSRFVDGLVSASLFMDAFDPHHLCFRQCGLYLQKTTYPPASLSCMFSELLFRLRLIPILFHPHHSIKAALEEAATDPPCQMSQFPSCHLS